MKYKIFIPIAIGTIKNSNSIRKKTALFIAALTLLGNALAQQEYTYTFFAENTAFFNPAAAGSHSYGTMTGSFRKQWLDFNGSPTSGGVLYEAPIKKYNMGFGAMLYQDHIGVTNQTHTGAIYSYHVRLGDPGSHRNHNLAFGLNAGLDLVTTKYQQLVYWDLNDEVFQSNYISQAVPHFGAGAYYYAEKFYAGISVPRIISINTRKFNAANLPDAPVFLSHYYLNAGYDASLGDNFSMRTSLLLKYVRNIRPQADLSVLAMYKKLVGIGAAYKSFGFASAFLQYHYKEAVIFGYAYDFSLNPLQQYSKGSHEILLQYRFVLTPVERKKHRASID
jgi:type IX secretion system PorP/SprF family membrane protein